MSKGYEVLNILKTSRNELLEVFPAMFDEIAVHHVTLAYGANSEDYVENDFVVHAIGEISNDYIQAILVTVNGKTKRPDGKTFHITLSYDKENASPSDSNLISYNDKNMLSAPIEVKTKQSFIKFKGQ